MPLRIALAYNLRRETSSPDSLQAEYDPPATVDAIARALEAAGHHVTRIEADAEFARRLAATPTDIVFNIAEGLRGGSREAHVPAICEMLAVPCSGSGVLAQAVCQDKPFALRVLGAAGVPTARFWEVPPGAPTPEGLPLPAFVKPAREGSSMGVTAASLCADADAVRQQVATVHERFREPALVETFLPGREFTVGLVGRQPRVLPIREINHDQLPEGYPPIYSHRFKKEWDAPRFFTCPARVPRRLERRIGELALAAFAATRCRDVARIDVRCDTAGEPAVLEINPLPGLTPDYSDLPLMAAAGGLDFATLIGRILDAACARYDLRP